MQSEQLATWLVVAAMIAVGAVAWWFELRPAREIDATGLATLPRGLGSWESEEFPLAETVESKLQADYNISRTYQHPLGHLIWLYVGYYGTSRGGYPEHTPEVCYPSAGWKIERDRQVELDPKIPLSANEFIVARNGERRLVYFWYRSYRRTGMLGTLSASLDRLLGRLSEGRADGALVRISTPLEEGLESVARARLSDFAIRLESLLGEHWPLETAGS